MLWLIENNRNLGRYSQNFPSKSVVAQKRFLRLYLQSLLSKKVYDSENMKTLWTIFTKLAEQKNVTARISQYFRHVIKSTFKARRLHFGV